MSEAPSVLLALVGAHITNLADEAAASVGPEGSLCLMVVQEPHVWGVMRPESPDGYQVLGAFVREGGALQPDIPPPAHRVKWADEELPKIGRRILDRCPPAVGVALLVWFGDTIGELSSVWCLTAAITKDDAVIFAREWLGSRPS